MATRRGPARQILVVDDEESVGFFLKASLEEARCGYHVELVSSGEEALRVMRRRAFDLVITDLRMPGMNGLELMEEVRARYPHSRLILMTAYGNPTVEATAYRLGACRYINKPFSIDQLTATVAEALDEPEVPGRDMLMLSDEQFDAIAQCLADLRFEVGARCILLADVAGQMLAHVGETQGLELAPLVSLIGGSFATAFEMARYLGEDQARTLNYHEGERYDVYSSNVNAELFIVLLFQRAQQRSRVGMVWLYTRRALTRLDELVRSARRVSTGEILDHDFGSLLSDSFDQLLDDGPAGTTASDVHDDPVPGSAATPPSPPLAEDVADSTDQAPVDAPGEAPASADTFNLQQALEMGLIDVSWIEDDPGQRG